ncbi:hypothetical protein [Sphaerobacter sp.]|nr:hypothetical protein [Sphaerobacter sp.]
MGIVEVVGPTLLDLSLFGFGFLLLSGMVVYSGVRLRHWRRARRP